MEEEAVWLNPHLPELAVAGWVIEYNRGRIGILEAFYVSKTFHRLFGARCPSC